MKLLQILIFLGFCLPSINGFGQSARIQGIILDSENNPVSNVDILSGQTGVVSDKDGYYNLMVAANTDLTIRFSHLSYKPVILKLRLREGEVYEFHPVLKYDLQQIGEVTVSGNGRKQVEGIQNISPADIRLIPGANAGVENILQLLPGVNSNNELSTQYSVRGGNYDENLVYVNEIEVYRPFLIRSGQQEGLSFINTDLIANVDFSAGGFQAKYGDKLSSVLDVTYKTPTEFGAGVQASFLGGSAYLETGGKDSRFSSITGVRYRNNSLLVNSKQTETNYNPVFADIQTYLSLNLTARFNLNFLGNVSVNDYDYEPLTRQTNFGTLQEPIALIVQYNGRERDKYTTVFGALKAEYKASQNLNLKFITSAYHTREQEYFDILAQYRLGEVNSNIGSEDLGNVIFSEGIGSQLNHGRNLLDAVILNAEHKGNFNLKNHDFRWGIKYSYENIRDRLQEYEVIDSAGFAIRPPIASFTNNQPYTPYTGALEPYQNVNSKNQVTIDRVSGFLQWSKKVNLRNAILWLNAGARFQYWNVKGEGLTGASHTIFSPRGQIALKPAWKQDMLFRITGGLYQQPPFYRELRDFEGVVHPEVKAQKSWHLVTGHDYSFDMWDRPFKLITEAYYKNLYDVNPYTLENVRIRYRANNSAVAYAYGLDTRLHGEFVQGTQSWFSFGYLKTEENIENRGYISRPTDQRLKFGLMFQDYVPSIPNLKLYLNGVYNTGLPGGSPNYADPYDYQLRLRDYKRVDLGISYVLTDANNRKPKGNWLHNFKEMSLGFEIFNIFDIRNAITNTWVRDVYTKRQYGIPNFMTGRVLNIKVGMQF